MFIILNLELVLDLFYPKVCGICESIAKEGLCNVCSKDISKLAVYRADEYKLDSNKFFSSHMYVFNYTGLIREKIIEYKFNEKAYLCDFFVNCILKDEKISREIKSCDMIIPVPIHKKRKLQRGYNQSELIAKGLAKNTGIKLVLKLLYKKSNTIEQSKLNKSERTKNVKNVYVIIKTEEIEGKKVLLFDDIYTTGATVNECSRILLQNGAKKVCVLTIAKD